jgi:molybdopterin converting factor small subunit
MKILVHGRLAEAIGRAIDLDAAPGCSVAELRERLIAEHPEAEQPLRSRRARTCVGDAMVHDNYVLQASDTIEFLPPVSGG